MCTDATWNSEEELKKSCWTVGTHCICKSKRWWQKVITDLQLILKFHKMSAMSAWMVNCIIHFEKPNISGHDDDCFYNRTTRWSRCKQTPLEEPNPGWIKFYIHFIMTLMKTRKIYHQLMNVNTVQFVQTRTCWKGWKIVLTMSHQWHHWKVMYLQ